MNPSSPSTSAQEGQVEGKSGQKIAQKRVDPASLPLGVVTEIRAGVMLVGIQPALAPSLRIGELVIVNGVTMAIVGEIVSIQRAQHTHAEVKLLVSINSSTASISPGAREFPGIGAQVYRPPRDVVRAISEDRTSLKDGAVEEVRLHLAYSSRYDSLEVAFPPEKIIGRHLAVVGSSGGGKSCTVARLIEQCAMHRSKVILLDLTGEYETLEGPVFHVHLGTAHRDGPLSSATCLPFYELTEADLVAVLEPENALQLSKLQTAIRTLKLLHLEPKLGTDGVFPKAHKEKRLFDQAIDDFKHDLEVPQNLFDIYRLALQLELECVDIYRSQTETGFWGGINQDELAAISGLIHRTQEILTRGDLAAIFVPHAAPSLIAILDTFLSDDNVAVLRISCEFLPSIHHVREIVANAIGRRMLELGRRRVFMQRPSLLVLDEAHQVLHPTASQFVRDFPLDAYHIIAKEGRKYGLSLCVATQRPGDIPADILSQMGTFIVHRLVGSSDRAIVEWATGACDKAILDDLPSLTPGEAIILGSAFTRSLRVHIRLPDRQPYSHGPSYQTLWRK
jgi:hypothetical protein